MTREFTDEELTAYLDSEHDFAPVTEIEATLKTDLLLQRRLEGLSVDRAALKKSLDALLRQAPQMPAIAAEAQQPSATATHFKWQALAAACILALGIGMGHWFTSANPILQSWQDHVAAYQALYGKDTLASLAPSSDEMTAELGRVENALGKSLPAAKLTAINGLTFKRAQLLSFESGPLAQISFVTGEGEPIALCIKRGTAKSEVSAQNRLGLASSSWAHDGYEYLLIGGNDQAVIDKASKVFSAEL